MRTVYPQPGHTVQELHDLLASKQFVFVDIFTILPKVGDPLRYSTSQRTIQLYPIDEPVTLTQFKSGQVKVSGLQLKIGVGTQVDEQTVVMDFPPGLKYYGMSYAEAIKIGKFDGSTVVRERYFAHAWPGAGQPIDWVAGVKVFAGRFSSVDKIGRSFAEFKVKSELLLLNMKMPRNVFQPGCNNSFGDPVCKYPRELNRTDAVVGAGSTQTRIYSPLVLQAHKFGTVRFEDVNNVLFIRTIKDVVVGSYLDLAYPLEYVPDVGEQMEILPGCVRTHAACQGYNNTPNFKGFPWVPVAETAY